MYTPANADLVAVALLRYFRDPVQYREEMLHQNEATSNLDLVVRLTLGRPVEFSSPGLRGPDVAQELRRAAVFFFQHILFRDGANHYQVLGLPPNASPETIRENRRLLIRVVHPDRHNTSVVWPENIAARVNRACSVLRNADTRAAYDQQEAAARSKLEFGPGTASAYPASARGVVRTRRPVPASALPEWLTVGVGGFVREHPSFTIFASLITLSVLVIGGAVWSEREVTLTRDPAKAATAPAPGPAPGDKPVIAGSTQPLLAASGPARVPSPAVVAQVALEGRIRSGATEQSVPVMAQPAAMSRMTNSAEAVARTSHRSVVQGEPAVATPKQAEPVLATPKQAEPVLATPKQAEPVLATPKQAEPAVAPPPAPPVVQTVAAAAVAAARPAATPISAEPLPGAHSQAPNAAEVEALIGAFISYYEAGHLDAFAALFDVDARTNEFRGRAAIRTEYNELFHRTSWRRMNLQHLQWRPVGERTEANGVLTMKIGWRDGREVEQRIAVEMELVRRGNRTVIARLSQQVRN